MRLGGIFDHLGFGFHRYSIDQWWLVPHFEKMLYDQALLAIAYSEAYQATGDEFYKETAVEILTFVLRDMRAPEGGFYSAEDADSEGVEGKFYVWSLDEIRELLSREDAEFFVKIFNVEINGNFFEEAARKKTGKSILYLRKPLSELAGELEISIEELRERLEKIRLRLFEKRGRRIRPARDEKILTDWNGLMIAALAIAARALNESRYADAAQRTVDFILSKVMGPNGTLLHRYTDGEALVKGFLDDYAFMVWGLLELYEATFEAGYLGKAVSLNERMLEHFWDDEGGGLFFTPDDGEALIVRKKEIYDGAIPSGNSVAMANLIRLSRITSNMDLEKKAIEIGKAFSETVKNSPAAYTHLLSAVNLMAAPFYEVVIVGDPEKEETRKILKTLWKEFFPKKVVLFKPSHLKESEISKIAGFTADYGEVGGKATVYVCSYYSCKSPTNDPDDMVELLKSGSFGR
jgi:uncharacterized protein YyaL (SSP411 family)